MHIIYDVINLINIVILPTELQKKENFLLLFLFLL